MKAINFYIEALKLGEKNLFEGISYGEVLQYLNLSSSIHEPKANFERTFRVWFYQNFQCEGLENKVVTRPDFFHLESFIWRKCFLSGEGYLALQDYRELQEARASSKTAMIFAIISIGISIIMGFIQIIW